MNGNDEFLDFMARLEMMQRQRQMQQQQQQGPEMPPMGMANQFMGSGPGMPPGGEGGPPGGGLSATSGGGLAAIILAAIAAQHALSKKTSTTFEGQETGDVFSGNFMTEPWQGFAYDKLGMDPSSGQRFDAAIKNKDYTLAAKRFPEASDYWADPLRHTTGDVLDKYVSPKVANVFDPMRFLYRKILG